MAGKRAPHLEGPRDTGAASTMGGYWASQNGRSRQNQSCGDRSISALGVACSSHVKRYQRFPLASRNTRNKAHEQPASRNTALCSRLCLFAAPPPDVTTVLATDWSWRHEAPKHRRQTSSVPPASYVNSRTTSINVNVVDG
ncbi:hypothetical protein NDU88_010843 [Pleurodeles waltl]|uniref:Uncharacterized protein n=1 Tax=Pleurodeles waltl TaxID=8319 RepID=A0AAV7R1P9_PLEWA|nr:hypothetical protein NDU88_010843 [Pleurodeles waltl]